MVKLFQELGWEPLQIRRNKHKLVTFYKILHGLTPTYLFDLIPSHINETNDYPQRNGYLFQNFRSNSNLFHESLFHSTIRTWNNLPNEIKETTSVSAFKFQFNKKNFQSHLNTSMFFATRSSSPSKTSNGMQCFKCRPLSK